MKIICILLIIIFSISALAGGPKKCKDRDVCIFGSGAAGMSAAVFLKDKGYDVLVLEKRNKVGGHCDTSYFTPPPGQTQNWLELGVQLFPDTTFENASGIGKWTLGSREFAQRFLPPASTINYAVTTPNYGMDFIHQFYTGLIPPVPPTQDYIDTFVRFNTLLATKYAWLENVEFPDPIPRDLVTPFSTFIAANNLSAITSFFYAQLYFGGLGDYRNVTTLYALQNLRRGISTIYVDPRAGFTIKNGCSSLYANIQNYIGAANVVLNANTTNVKRRGSDSTVTYSLPDGSQNEVKCNNLFFAFPQTKENLAFIDLDGEERNVFNDVQIRYYYKMQVNAQGPIATNSNFNLASIDVTNPALIPPFPNLLVLRREIAYGPTAAYGYSYTDVPQADITNLFTSYLNVIPNAALTTKTLTSIARHSFQAHFTDEALRKSNSPYARLAKLQGKKNTYWGGALLSFAESATIWQKTKTLIDKYFTTKRR